MKISLTSISIGDRVNAAKTNPSSTDTSKVPSDINPSPGDSSITPVDTTSIDSAGANVNGQTQKGNNATSDSARKTNNPANQNLQYDNQKVSAEDQAPTANKSTDIAGTPQPKSKGFKESLIDAAMGQMMGDNSGGDHGKVDRDFGHNNGDPNENIKDQPASQPIRRTQQSPYDNSGNKVGEPGPYPISSFDKSPDVEPYKAPKTDLGPQYVQKTINQPTVKYTTPKFNAPRFK